MIKAITYNEIIIKLRKVLSEQSGINLNLIVNSASVRGADLMKIINSVDVNSIDLNDTFISFELIEDDNNDNYAIVEKDYSISSLASFKFIARIYGNSSHMISQQIYTRFKSEDVATDLRNNGIYLRGIEYPTNVKEFINNTLWDRCDITLNLKVRFNFKQKSEVQYFNQNIKSVNLNVKKV